MVERVINGNAAAEKVRDRVAGRNIALDCAKGIAIVLVVFGHEVETHLNWFSVSRSASGLWYWTAIHYFHMALFVFVSGYLAFGKLDFKYLQRRSLQLIPAFILWSIVLYYASTLWVTGLQGVYPVKTGLMNSLFYCLWSLDASGLWFLPLLLALYLIAYASRRHLSIVFGIIILSYVISQLPWPSWSFFNHQLVRPDWFSRIAWFMPFFVSGYLISKYKDRLQKISFFKWVALIAFPVFFIWGGNLNSTTPLYSWPAYSVFTHGDMVLAFYGFLMAFLGIGMVFAVVDLLTKISYLSIPLIYLGQITLGIYCASNLCRNIGATIGIWWILSATVISILFSVSLIWLLQRFRVTNYMFLGGAQKLALRKTS
jgi:fucose 4-O-acetylase-like acetyltransferase